MNKEEIDSIRNKIRAVDEKILALVAERLKEAEAIGRLKRDNSAPLRDYTVEAQVLEHAEDVCSRLGVDRQIGRDVAKILINAAVSVQSYSDIRVYRGTSKKIFIVGGNGKMGRWFSSFFNIQGHDVSVNDVTGDSPYRSEGIEEGAANADVVLLSTPISVTPSLLSRVMSTGTQALVLDSCSLKSPIVSLLRRGAAEGMKVASIHPMFGPGARTLADQHLIVCDCGSAAAADEATSLFSDTCLSISRLEVESHDELMGYLLGMTHAANIMLFNALAYGGRNYAELSRFASTTFTKQMQTTFDFAVENPSLYYEIQNLNSHRERVFSLLEKSLADLRRASFSADSSDFILLMERGREFFRGYGQ